MAPKNPYELSGQERELLGHVLETVQLTYHFELIGAITSSEILLLNAGLDVTVRGTLDFACRQSCHRAQGQFELHYGINSHTEITDRFTYPADAVEMLQLTVTPTTEEQAITIEVASDSNKLRTTVFSQNQLDELVRNEIDDILHQAWLMVKSWDHSDEGDRINKLIEKRRKKYLREAFQEYQNNMRKSGS